MKPLHERRRRSARETFAACRARYKAEYIDGVDMSSAATRRGNCFHLAVELYLSWLWQHEQTDNAEEAQRCLSEARVATAGLTFEEWSDVESLWSRWAPDFRLNFATFYSVEGAQPCFDTVLRYDRVEVPDADTLRIYDAKTHWRIIPQSHLEANWQTAFYLAAARHIFPGFHRYELVYEFIRYAVASDVICKTFSELDVIEQAIKESDEAMADAEDTNVFPATGGKHCRTCALATVCTAFTPEWHPLDELLTHKAARLATVQRALAILTESIRDYTEEHGPIIAGGLEYAHRPKFYRQYPAIEVLDTLAAFDFNTAATRLRLSHSAVKPFIESKKKYKTVADALKALAIESTSTEFSGRPVVPDETDETPETE